MIYNAIQLDLVLIVVWVIVFFVAVLVEVLEPQLVSIWFAGGALIALLATTLFNAPLWLQIILFIFTTIALLILTRPFVKRVSHLPVTPTNADALIGQDILIEKAFGPKKEGYGLHADIRWTLVSDSPDTFEKGEYAVIKGIHGNKLTVSKKGR
jgi:membrane protein implicated in regulation of membrane protease activity